MKTSALLFSGQNEVSRILKVRHSALLLFKEIKIHNLVVQSGADQNFVITKVCSLGIGTVIYSI